MFYETTSTERGTRPGSHRTTLCAVSSTSKVMQIQVPSPSLSAAHSRRIVKELFSRAFDVFVAACLTRFVASFRGSSLSTQIHLFAAYAVISHVLAVAFICLHPFKALYEYSVFIAIESTGFAWRELTSLLILKWMISTSPIKIAFAAFVLILFLSVAFVYVSNLALVLICARNKSLNPDSDMHSDLRNLNSEAFALSLAFALALIVVDVVYPQQRATYLANVTDDDGAMREGAGSAASTWLFLCYALIATIASSVMYVPTPAIEGPVSAEETREEGEEEKDDLDPSDQSCWARLIESCNIILFWFDRGGTTRSALLHYYNTSLGFFVGVAWWAWSVLSWQELFVALPLGRLFGLFLYAVIVTAVVVRILIFLTVREEKLVMRTGIARRRAGLHMITGKLLVGWSWSDFITELFAALVPAGDDNHRVLTAVVKGLVAVVAIAAGAFVVLSWRPNDAPPDDDVWSGDAPSSRTSADEADLSKPLLI